MTQLALCDDRHVFLDRLMLDTVSSARTEVNPPEWKEYVLHADQLWEQNGVLGGNVFWDDLHKEYRMYYAAVNLDVAPFFYLALATSQDTIRWTKPRLGAVEWGGSTSNNIVLALCNRGGGHSVLVDPNADPQHRYATTQTTLAGVDLYTSPDGIDWSGPHSLSTDLQVDGGMVSFWDGQRQCYMHYPRITDDPMFGRERKIGWLATSSMDEVWPAATSIPVVMQGDDQDPAAVDLYLSATHKYELAPRAYVAFPPTYYHYNCAPASVTALSQAAPELFQKDRGVERCEGGVAAGDARAGGHRAYLNEPALAAGGTINDGVIDSQLAVSRDGVTWRRYRTPYVAMHRHTEAGEPALDLKIVMPYQGVLYQEDHLVQYFSGAPFTHGDTQARRRLHGRQLGGAFRLEQRIDGFTSLDFDYGGGTVVTDPFTFTGSMLTLNVNTSAAGEGRVAILDAQGKEIPGFGLGDARIVNGNHLRQPVTWMGPNNVNRDVSALERQPVRLRFDFRGTKLYSFEFHPGQQVDALVGVPRTQAGS